MARTRRYEEEALHTVYERDASCKMVLLRWSAVAVGAGSVPGGAVGGARFGILRLGEGRVPTSLLQTPAPLFLASGTLPLRFTYAGINLANHPAAQSAYKGRGETGQETHTPNPKTPP
jgi:hypothetical protein